MCVHNDFKLMCPECGFVGDFAIHTIAVVAIRGTVATKVIVDSYMPKGDHPHTICRCLNCWHQGSPHEFELKEKHYEDAS